MIRRSIDAVIPARNEASTVGAVVEVLRSTGRLQRVIVVDHASTDSTSAVARAAGAEVLECRTPGLGAAIKVGIESSTADWIFRTDADIDNWSSAWLDAMLDARADLVRAYFDSPYDDFPVTKLVAEPLWELLNAPAPVPRRMLSGTYLFRRGAFDMSVISNTWAFDISLLCAANDKGLEMSTVDIGSLSDRKRSMAHYVPMAREIIEYMLERGAMNGAGDKF